MVNSTATSMTYYRGTLNIKKLKSSYCIPPLFKKVDRSIKKSNLISPCYITISYDIRKPEIIKRDPDSYSIESGDFVIQTNCDNDKLEPNILYSIERRNICKNIIMKKNNLFGSIDELLNLLHIEPVLNSETIYINILNPNQKPITYI